MCKGTLVVAESSRRIGKFYGDIGRGERRRIKVLYVVNINDTYDFVATVTGNLLDHVPHLAVTDQC